MAMDSLKGRRVMDAKSSDPFSELSSYTHLFERLDRDIRSVRQRFSAFEEALASFRNGWLAISLCYDVLKEEKNLREEEKSKQNLGHCRLRPNVSKGVARSGDCARSQKWTFLLSESDAGVGIRITAPASVSISSPSMPSKSAALCVTSGTPSNSAVAACQASAVWIGRPRRRLSCITFAHSRQRARLKG